MKKICKICGREFEGKANACICSGPCRLEAQKKYQQKYKINNMNKIRKRQRNWYHNNKALGAVNSSDNLDLEFDRDKEVKKQNKFAKKKFTGSAWAERYTNLSRLDRIALLSKELSDYKLANLSYGTLSGMYETGRYNALLHKVLRIKENEEKNK